MWVKIFFHIFFLLFSVSFVLFRGKNKHISSLLYIVWKAGDGFDCHRGVRGWTIAVTITKRMQYIFRLLIFPSSYFPAHIPLNMLNHPRFNNTSQNELTTDIFWSSFLFVCSSHSAMSLKLVSNSHPSPTACFKRIWKNISNVYLRTSNSSEDWHKTLSRWKV